MTLLATQSISVGFIACHGGPADHFASYAQTLIRQHHPVYVCASEFALKQFQDRGIEVSFPFSLEGLSSQQEESLAAQIAKACSIASIVITDVGHTFDIKIQTALAQYEDRLRRFAYYDNPEPFVPGGYSSIAAQVMLKAQRILFANDTLSISKIYNEAEKELDLGNRKRMGIGYYPITHANAIRERRKNERNEIRCQVLTKIAVENRGQSIWVYFGGNNKEYFSKAFPAFLSLLSQTLEQIDLTDIIILIQQHPGAKRKNLDTEQLAAWLNKAEKQAKTPKVIISNFSSDEAQVVADAALYYQTSMAPQLALAEIPVIQIGHETYPDILTRNQLAFSVTSASELVCAITRLKEVKKTLPKKLIFKALGIKKDWRIALERAIKRNGI